MHKFVKKMDKPWENPEIIHRFDDGWTIVRVQTAWDYGLEGWFLDHCLGTKHFDTFEIGHRVFSLRDKNGTPHATILGLLPDIVSPYMGFADLGVSDFFAIGGENLKILQVRGRKDGLARPEFLYKVGEWLGYPPATSVVLSSKIFGDKDKKYHTKGLLDEDRDWSWWTPDSEAPQYPGIKEGWLSL